jgi:hypothetical protein
MEKCLLAFKIFYRSKVSDLRIAASISDSFRGDARFDLNGFDLHSICGEPGDSGYWQNLTPIEKYDFCLIFSIYL